PKLSDGRAALAMPRSIKGLACMSRRVIVELCLLGEASLRGAGCTEAFVAFDLAIDALGLVAAETGACFGAARAGTLIGGGTAFVDTLGESAAAAELVGEGPEGVSCVPSGKGNVLSWDSIAIKDKFGFFTDSWRSFCCSCQ